LARNPIGAGTSFVIGVGANPGLPNLDEEIKRFEYKVEAGRGIRGDPARIRPQFAGEFPENGSSTAEFP